jgi:hypothetical protein
MLLPQALGCSVALSRLQTIHTNLCRKNMKRDGDNYFHQPIPAQLAHLHWSSGHDFRLSRVKSRQARETRVRFPDGEHHVFVSLCSIVLNINEGRNNLIGSKQAFPTRVICISKKSCFPNVNTT